MSIGLEDENLLKFIDKLKDSIIDKKIIPRIKKATEMFKKQKNLLYINKDNESLKAVIKSQTTEKLEYAVYLKNDGNFFCSSQNLNPCGGLDGKICKHIILALLAVIKSRAAKTSKLIEWVNETRNYKPRLIKPEVMAIFSKYQEALDGKIDWRPVEISSEDFIN